MVLQNAFEDLSTEATLEAVRSLLGAAYGIVELFTDGSNVAAASSVTSGWFDFQTLKIDSLRITRTSSAGTYGFEIDWSRDGITADVIETVVVTNNTSVFKTVATRYGRVRIRNTDGFDALSAHRTVVTGRSR